MSNIVKCKKNEGKEAELAQDRDLSHAIQRSLRSEATQTKEQMAKEIASLKQILEQQTEEISNLKQNQSQHQHQINHILQKVLIFIICIGKYDDKQDLYDPPNDKSKLINVFNKHYNYRIIYNTNNYVKYRDIEDVILPATKKEFRSEIGKYECIMLFYSGHGNETGIITSDGETYPRTKIEKYFNGIYATDQLFSYKFMFFDSCRGKDESYTMPMSPQRKGSDEKMIQNKDNDDNKNDMIETEIHPEHNRCIMYSNPNTYKSYGIPMNKTPKSQSKYNDYNNEDDEKKSNDNNINDKEYSSPFLDAVAQIFTQNALDKDYKMNFSEIQDEIRDLAENRIFYDKEDIHKLKPLRLKIEEFTTISNKDKFGIVFEKNKDRKKDKSDSPNVLDYESWNNSDILSWIISLDHGKFKKYKDILSKNLSEEEVMGVDLKRVKESHLKAWGVNNFNERTKLFDKIQDLMLLSSL